MEILPTVSGLDLSRQFPGYDTFETPKVVIDEAILVRNITDMATLVGKLAALHPHVKTHKSLEIARLQRAHGAAGFTVARPYEANMLIENGLTPVTLAYPQVSSETIVSLLKIVDRSEDIRFITDSDFTVDVLRQAALESGRIAHIFLKIDVGLHRCGIDPDSDDVLNLAKKIDSDPCMRFVGLLSHAGHAYGGKNPEDVRSIAQVELEIMRNTRTLLEKNGVSVPCVSVGSTPSLVANAGFEGVDEVRPGNYVFYDLTAVRLGLVKRSDVSLAVAAKIISVNRHFAIANVGSKTLSSDLGAHGTSATTTFGEAWLMGAEEPLHIVKLSEEHAFLKFDGAPPQIGTPILILPNHSCPVANLSGGLNFLGERRRFVDVEGFVS